MTETDTRQVVRPFMYEGRIQVSMIATQKILLPEFSEALARIDRRKPFVAQSMTAQQKLNSRRSSEQTVKSLTYSSECLR